MADKGIYLTSLKQSHVFFLIEDELSGIGKRRLYEEF